MQVQQQSEINLGSVKKLEANKTTQDKSVDTHESKQASPFEDQLKKQIDQTKKLENKENIDKNQDDSEQGTGEVIAAKDAQEVTEGLTEELTSEVAEMAVYEESTTKQIEEFELTSGLITQQMNDVELASPGNGTAVELPEAGNVLPLSESIEGTTESIELTEMKSVQQTLVQPLVQPSAEKQVAAAIDPTLKQVPPAQVVESVSVTARSQPVINSEASSASPVAYKAVSLTDKINTQAGKLTSPVSELPAAEVITQTTRLQQVPLVTQVSSNLNEHQNMNLISSAVLSDINTTINSPSSFNNALGTTLSSTITTGFQNPQWSQQMTDQVSFMLKGGFQQAEIKLNPAHLGPMEIKLSIIDDQASVSFVAQHAPVRDALDAAIPRLREMLEQQGLNLADVDVSTQSQQQQNGNGTENEMNNVVSDEDNNNVDGQAESKLTHLNMEIQSGVSIYA